MEQEVENQRKEITQGERDALMDLEFVKELSDILGCEKEEEKNTKNYPVNSRTELSHHCVDAPREEKYSETIRISCQEAAKVNLHFTFSQKEEKEEQTRIKINVTQEELDKLNESLDETINCFKRTYDIKSGKKLVRKRKIKEILTKKQKKNLVDLLDDKFPKELQNKLQNIAENNLELMNVVGYFSMRLVQFCACPIKFFCEEF